MGKDRTSKFWWDYKAPRFITLQSMRGTYDPALSSDCRCGVECPACEYYHRCDIRPWMALSSKDAWGEESLTPEGLADGDTINPDSVGTPFEEWLACDIYGEPYALNREEAHDEEFYFLEKLEEERKDMEYLASMQGEESESDSREYDEVPLEDDTWEYEFSAGYYDDFHQEFITFELPDHPTEKINGYDHTLDDLPSHSSSSHTIVSPGYTSRRINCCSYQNGKRGNDRYKDIRNGKKVRVSAKKHRKIAELIGYPFVYNLLSDQDPRVVTV